MEADSWLFQQSSLKQDRVFIIVPHLTWVHIITMITLTIAKYTLTNQKMQRWKLEIRLRWRPILRKKTMVTKPSVKPSLYLYSLINIIFILCTYLTVINPYIYIRPIYLIYIHIPYYFKTFTAIHHLRPFLYLNSCRP